MVLPNADYCRLISVPMEPMYEKFTQSPYRIRTTIMVSNDSNAVEITFFPLCTSNVGSGVRILASCSEVCETKHETGLDPHSTLQSRVGCLIGSRFPPVPPVSCATLWFSHAVVPTSSYFFALLTSVANYSQNGRCYVFRVPRAAFAPRAVRASRVQANKAVFAVRSPKFVGQFKLQLICVSALTEHLGWRVDAFGHRCFLPASRTPHASNQRNNFEQMTPLL
eukprot:1177054-Prorocentrum_minimum.AAC.3